MSKILMQRCFMQKIKERPTFRVPLLYDWLKRNHLRKKQLAKELGLTENGMSLIFTGRREPGLYLFARLCVITGLDPRQLLGLADPEDAKMDPESQGESLPETSGDRPTVAMAQTQEWIC